MKNYELLGFRKSKRKNKKYDAILKNMKTNRLKYIPFGDNRYEHYEDKTGLELYNNKNHYDKKRRENYRKRHRNDNLNKYSPGYFSYYYLW